MAEGERSAVILGVDPGSRVVGWGAVVWQGSSRVSLLQYGALRVSGCSTGRRLAAVHRGMLQIFERIGPDTVVLEEVFYGKSFQSALRVGEARGVCLLAATQAGIPAVSYTPAEVKRAVTGNGRAHKSQVQAMVAQLLQLGEIPRPPDAADALACALCHSHRLSLPGADST